MRRRGSKYTDQRIIWLESPFGLESLLEYVQPRSRVLIELSRALLHTEWRAESQSYPVAGI